MCYKFIQPTDIDILVKDFPVTTENNTVEVSGKGYVIIKKEENILSQEMTYGFKNNLGYTYYNARYETAASLPTWNYAYRNHRCIIPITSFLEGRPNNPKLFIAEKETLYAAGLYNSKKQFCILTCDALGEVKKYDDRYPLFLTKDTIKIWVNTNRVVNVTELAKCAVEEPNGLVYHDVVN